MTPIKWGRRLFIEPKKKVMLLILSPILLCLLLYAGGFVAQFLINYKLWQTGDGGLVSGTAPQLPSTRIIDCAAALFHLPEGLIGVAICVAVVLFLVLFVFRIGRDGGGTLDKDRKLTYADSGSYGTAGFMTDKEMQQVLQSVDVKNTDGIILGRRGNKAICLPADTRMNRNIAVYGASGSMKSRAFVRNMALQAVKRGESVIITDPKSELYEDMAGYFSANGYAVRVFNLIRPENSDSWNCLGEINGDELMAQTLCDTIIKNTTTGKSDHFWDNSELNLLKSLALYVSLSYPEGSKNMGEVYHLLCDKTEPELSAIIEKLPPGHPARAPYNIYKQAGESVRGGIIIGLGSRLQVFQNEKIRKITSFDEIDLEMPARKKCAYFCITSDQDSTFDFLSSLFFSFLFIKLVRYADAHGKNGRCDVPVDFILDEFPNAGTIVDFKKKISTIRSRAISVAVIFQNLAQMQNRYPDNVWQEIIGNCDTQLALGCTDELTAKFISERTGDITIGITSTAKTLSSWQVSNYTPEYRESSGYGRRKLMTMDEVLRMPLEKELLIIRGQKVLMLDKFDYTLHPESGKLVKCRASEYIPQWRSNEILTEKARQEQEKQEAEAMAEKPVLANNGEQLDTERQPPDGEPGKPIQENKQKGSSRTPRKKYRSLD